MMERAEGQIPFGELGVELVVDLDSGERSLQRKRTRRPRKTQATQEAAPVRVPRRVPTRQWWDRMGLRTFRDAAEGWKISRAARAAENFGHNVEFVGAEMSGAETEERLKQAFRVAQRSGITSLAVAEMLRAETLRLEDRYGREVGWLPEFVDFAVDQMADVYNVRLERREALRTIAHFGTLLT